MLHQISPKIETFLQEVKLIYQHPLHYTYILHKNDGYLHLYDQATMDIVGKTKVVVLDQIRMFAFTNDFNMFYGLRENRFLIFELSTSQWLAHIPLQSNHQVKPYLEAYYLCYYSKKQILICVTKTNFFLVSPTNGVNYKVVQQIKYQEQLIFPQKVAQISGLQWIIGYKNALYFLKFSSKFDSYQITDRLHVGNIVRLSTQYYPKKQFIYVINDSNEALLIHIDKNSYKMSICYKFQNSNCVPLYMTLLRLGINTSTTDKFRNRLYISIYCKQKNSQINNQNNKMVEQIAQNSINTQKYCLFIIPTQVEKLTENENIQQSLTKINIRPMEESFYIKDMPQIKISPWINIFTENYLLFLTVQNKVCYIDFTAIKQLNLKADQWICMGYKFQELEKNQVYEQRQDQFEDQSQKEQINLTKEFLDDWSQSNLPKEILLNKAYNRIRSYDL